MSKNPYPNIHKSKLDLTIDLFHSLRIVKDSLEMMKKGHFYQLSIIYTQLRVLLTDKSSKGVSPLLPLISDYFNGDLDFYYRKTVPISESAHFEYMNHELSLKKISDNHTNIHINDYLNETAIIVEGRQIKVKELIGHLANSYGGAHYSSKFPEYLLKLKFFKLGEHTVFDTYIIQLAELCLQLGIKVLKQISDFSNFSFIFLPKVESVYEEALFDFKHSRTSNRVTLFYKENKFHISIIDSFGRQFLKHNKNDINFNQYYFIKVSHNITNNLESNFKVYINNILQINEIEENPYLSLNMLIQYDRYFNKFYNKENNCFKFLLIYNAFDCKEVDEKFDLLCYEKVKNIIEAPLLEENAFAYCKSGERELKIKGGKIVNVKEYVKNSKSN